MKKRNKVSAEFSMSSLTDIIFLLLIFFMLTSSMVQINIPLPKSDSKTVAPSDLIVMMTKDGRLTFNGKKISKSALQGKIKSELASMSNRENASISIVAEVDVPWDKIYDVMVIASKLKVKAHIATQPRK
ncbi:MAG: biopolymer transporter ExbD [Bacteroidia bacterium]|nr:biopolymer transporter ExbD [Bacteroidia bacterium]MBT8230055.1 biopolymer transporter ExbD [Bacteroidia bacterium]